MSNAIEFYGKEVMKVMQEIAGEDYVVNKRREKNDALNEAIDGAVEDCIITVVEMVAAFYTEKNPSWQRVLEIHKEAVERIKKFLK